jgi:hypothetical protein
MHVFAVLTRERLLVAGLQVSLAQQEFRVQRVRQVSRVEPVRQASQVSQAQQEFGSTDVTGGCAFFVGFFVDIFLANPTLWPATCTFFFLASPTCHFKNQS